MEPLKLPTHVDEPQMVFFWSADEIVPALIIFTLGFLAQQALLFSLIALASAKLFRRYRDSHPDGFLLHFVYWCGFLGERGLTIRNPYRRRYLP